MLRVKKSFFSSFKLKERLSVSVSFTHFCVCTKHREDWSQQHFASCFDSSADSDVLTDHTINSALLVSAHPRASLPLMDDLAVVKAKKWFQLVAHPLTQFYKLQWWFGRVNEQAKTLGMGYSLKFCKLPSLLWAFKCQIYNCEEMEKL